MPESSFDDELRAVVLAHVQQLRDRFGGRIPSSEIKLGVMVRGARVPIWNYQKGIFKPAALGRDGAALSVQTSAESPYADAHDARAGRFMYKYRGTDPGNPDNVALRTAMWQRKPLVYFVAVDPGVYDAIAPVYVTGDEPEQLQFTLMVDQAPTEASLGDDAATDARRQYITRAVLRRLHQQRFRRLVLAAYHERCAICRLRHVELLDAAHILPDSDPRGEPMVSNGLGLCKIHHAAFDAHILGIDPDAQVHIRADVLEEIDGPMLRYGLQAVEGSHLILPRQAELKPNRDFLSERFELFRTA
jgi:putative restriction endonuclease